MKCQHWLAITSRGRKLYLVLMPPALAYMHMEELEARLIELFLDEVLWYCDCTALAHAIRSKCLIRASKLCASEQVGEGSKMGMIAWSSCRWSKILLVTISLRIAYISDLVFSLFSRTEFLSISISADCPVARSIAFMVLPRNNRPLKRTMDARPELQVFPYLKHLLAFKY